MIQTRPQNSAKTIITVCALTLALHLVGAGLVSVGHDDGLGPKKDKTNTNQPIKMPPPVHELETESQAMQKALEAMGVEALAIHETMNDGQNMQYRRRIKPNGMDGYLK